MFSWLAAFCAFVIVGSGYDRSASCGWAVLGYQIIFALVWAMLVGACAVVALLARRWPCRWWSLLTVGAGRDSRTAWIATACFAFLPLLNSIPVLVLEFSHFGGAVEEGLAWGLILALCAGLSAAVLGPARVQAACSVLLPGAGHFLAGVPGGRLFAAAACVLSIAAPKVLYGFGNSWTGSPEVGTSLESSMAAGFVFAATTLGLAAALHFRRRFAG